MRLELHCHSTCSDGSLAPEALARALLDFEPELACLTDHDTMAGCEELAATFAGDPRGRAVRVLRGLELSCKYQRRTTIHLLIWGVSNAGVPALQRRLDEQLQRRRERIVAICERLLTLGVELDAAAILTDASGRTPGRPDVARALVAAGVCPTTRAAFERYLRDNGPADVEIDSLELDEALSLGRQAGARMGLAHPHTLRHYAVVRELFERHRDAGLEGIEVYYGTASPTRAAPWLRLARELGLVPTAGSDFHGHHHGHGQGHAPSETARPGIELPDAHAPRLRDWLADVEALHGDSGHGDSGHGDSGHGDSGT